MASRLPAPEKELGALQIALRQRPAAAVGDPEQAARRGRQLSGRGAVSLSAQELARFRRAEQALLVDLRFEHLGDKTEDALWSFVRACIQDQRTD
jgi:hypothetical protein